MNEETLFQVHMPEVDVRPGLEEVFIQARELAQGETVLADGTQLRRVVFISPGRLLLIKDTYPPGTLPYENRIALEELIPSDKSMKIAVIAYTFLDALRADIRKAIPFFDYLLGFAYLGHAVWVFEGHSSVLKMGCQDADYVLVDKRMLPFLENEWGNMIRQQNETVKIRILDFAT